MTAVGQEGAGGEGADVSPRPGVLWLGSCQTEAQGSRGG